jgi:hypothetical protein
VLLSIQRCEGEFLVLERRRQRRLVWVHLGEAVRVASTGGGCEGSQHTALGAFGGVEGRRPTR